MIDDDIVDLLHLFPVDSSVGILCHKAAADIKRLRFIERNMLIENERLRGEVSLLKQALVDAKGFIFGHSGEPEPKSEPTLRLVIDNALEHKP